jgi:uncharacterized MAPEG superfamily protein
MKRTRCSGFRGASRYVDGQLPPCFELECRALRRVRNDMGLTNVWVMVPFVRTVGEAQGHGTAGGQRPAPRRERPASLIMMCELPTNALLAHQYLQYFDGMSIGSNDLTQLTLGLDRDSGLIAGLFDERDESVRMLIKMAIDACKQEGKYIGICGQGPSDHPDFARWLISEGISSVSLNPDTVIETWLFLAAGVAKAGARDFDNARPRDYLARLQGWRQRANWAQANSYESFPAFAAGVIVAHLAGAAQPGIDMLALGYVAARILYGIFYITDRSTLRSLAWVAGLGCIIGLFVTAA